MAGKKTKVMKICMGIMFCAAPPIAEITELKITKNIVPKMIEIK